MNPSRDRRSTLPIFFFLVSSIRAQEDTKAQQALDEAMKQLPEQPAPQPGASGIYARQVGPATLRLIDISLDGLFAAGSSTERDAELQNLQSGGHDPRKRGFTVQNVELSFQGAVDPYILGEAHLVYFIDPTSGESEFELEEAFLTTQQLPWGLQIKGGQFFTEFGRINPQHPHQWDWQDQPVINSRIFGPDGMRGAGARLSWLTPLPWYSALVGGIQNANGETMTSFLANDEFFEERSPQGRPFVEQEVRSFEDLAYLARWENSFEITETTTTKLGFSGAFGSNSTGSEGHSEVYGADIVVKWRPLENDKGWPFVIWQSEVMGRDYHADNAVDPDDGTIFSSALFRDFGFYTLLLYGFDRNWAAGARFEYATATGPSGDVRLDDPFRDDRIRVSPLLVYQPSEFSRLRLQYNYDNASHLSGDDAHSVWFGFEFMFGAHAAHTY
jgi:hypothetical protein